MNSAAHKKLNKHATSILLGGVFLFFSVLLYLTLCAMPCEYAHIEESDEETARYRKQLHDRKPHQTFLAILVLTGPKYFERRDIMRETWLSTHRTSKDVKVFFAIGTGTLSTEELRTLNYENSLHGDLLLMPTFNDTYYDLTTKVLESFRWLDHHVNFNFLLKVDDDTFVRLGNLLDEIKAVNVNSLYWGFFDGRARVKKSGKWAETNWILCDTYTPYTRGGGYILTADLVHYIARNAKYLQKFQSEDVSVGAWLGPLQINRKHDVRFDTEYRSRGCNNEYLVTHKQSIQDMKDKWQALKETGRLCKKEYQTRNSYEYNWNVSPSLCCIRNNTNIP